MNLKSLFEQWGAAPIFHAVLGSGFGTALKPEMENGWALDREILFQEFEGLNLKIPSAPDHQGKFVFYKKKDKRVCFQLGRLHGYEGISAREAVLPVMISRLAGVKRFFLTNASGGLNSKFEPGDVMLISDHVNLTGQNPLVGQNPTDTKGKPLGPRFPSLEALYCKETSKKMMVHLEKQKLMVHQGVYLGLLGPSFETPAEIRLFQKWGLDAVGMSTVWESIALGHSGATVCGISLISNMGCGLVTQVLEHEKILEVSRSSAGKVVQALLTLGDTLV